MKIKPYYFLISAFVSLNLQAGPVDADNIKIFQSGDPAVAAEVNGNFAEVISAINDNDSRLVTLLDSQPPAGGIRAFSVDCDADSAALANAINMAQIFVGLDITVTGTCDPISIIRDHVRITGPALITSDMDGNPPIAIESAGNVELLNLTLDAQNLANYSLLVDHQSEAIVDTLTTSGAVEHEAHISGSYLRLRGNNQFVASGATSGSLQGVAAYIGVEAGLNTISSINGCAVTLQASSFLTAIDANSIVNTNGCFRVSGQSTVDLKNNSMNGNLDLSGSSTVVVSANNGNNTVISGQMLINTNSTLILFGLDTATITTNGGNVSLISGGYVNVFNGVSFAADASNIVFMRGGRLSIFAGGSLQADNVITDLGSYLFFDVGSSVDASTGFLLRTNTALVSLEQNNPIPGSSVLCTSGAVAELRTSPETDLCL